MTGRQLHRTLTFVLSLAMVVLGVALIVQVVSGGGAVSSGRLLLGALFIAAGAGRTFILARGRGRRRV